jgi:hypothetical protein
MANLKADDKWFKRNRILVTVGPLLLIALGLFLAQLDKTPDVHYYKEVVRPGYEPAPAFYQVEASSKKEWGDYWGTRWGWALAGGLIILIGTFAYIGYLEAEVKEGNWKVLGAIWLAGILLVMLPFFTLVNSGDYETKLTPAQYELAKDSLDALFPFKN